MKLTPHSWHQYLGTLRRQAVYGGPYWIAGHNKNSLPLPPHAQSLLTFSVDVTCACTVAKFCFCYAAVYMVAAFTFNFRLCCCQLVF